MTVNKELLDACNRLVKQFDNIKIALRSPDYGPATKDVQFAKAAIAHAEEAEAFKAHLTAAQQIVSTWPAWKQLLLGGVAKRPAAPECTCGPSGPAYWHHNDCPRHGRKGGE